MKRNRHSSVGISGVALLVASAAVAVFAGWVIFRNPPSQSPASTTFAAEVRPSPTETSEPPDAPARVAFIGDSYTAGAGSLNGGFVSRLAHQRGWSVENLGVGGTGYLVNRHQNAAASRLACGHSYCRNYPENIRAAAAYHPDVVIVSGGRNNVGSPQTALHSGIPTFYRRLRAAVPDARIIATSPLWDSSRPPASLGLIASDVRKGVHAVDGRYLNLGQPLRRHPDLLAADHVHPNSAGYDAIVAEVSRRL